MWISCFHSKCYFLILWKRFWDPDFNIRINAVFVTHMVFNGKISSFFPFLSPSRKFPFRLKMSHNSKYYVKKLCKKDIKGQQKIGDVFKKINKGNDSVIWNQIRGYIITEDCNEIETWNFKKKKKKKNSSVNGHFRIETTKLKRVHVHSSLLVVTSNQNAFNKKKII